MANPGKTFLQSLLRLTGYEMHYSLGLPEDLKSEYPHQRLYTTATYAPWLADTAFQAAYSMTKGSTMVDVQRCFELWSLVGETARLEGDILEVGVWRGGTGGLMAKRAQLLGLPATVYLCDTFRGVAKAGPKDPMYRGGEHADTSIPHVENLLRSLGVGNFRILQGIFPDDTAHEVERNRFRLCHIDVDVYQSAKEVLEWVWPRLTVSGVCVFDDFGFWGCEGVTRLVEEQRGKPGRMILHNLNGHAIIFKTGESDE